MTIALCLHCGQTKFGAYLPCEHCQSPNLDRKVSVVFTDHYMDPATLLEFGKIIQLLHRHSDDDCLCLSAFYLYCSLDPVVMGMPDIWAVLWKRGAHREKIGKVHYSSLDSQEVEDLLVKAKPPIIKLIKGETKDETDYQDFGDL